MSATNLSPRSGEKKITAEVSNRTDASLGATNTKSHSFPEVLASAGVHPGNTYPIERNIRKPSIKRISTSLGPSEGAHTRWRLMVCPIVPA